MQPHKYREELHNLLGRLKQERLETQQRLESRKGRPKGHNFRDAAQQMVAARAAGAA